MHERRGSGSAGHRHAETPARGLSGTGLVADDLWLLSHDEVSGRPCIQPRPLGLGSAGGLLAEAALAGVIILGPGPVRAGRYGPREELAARLLRQVTGEPELHPVQEWLAYLAHTAAGDVAARLDRSGYLVRHAGLWPWRGRWVPVDRDSAFAPVLRVRAALDAARPPTVHEVLLAGLADACGLGFRLAQYTPVRSVRPLGEAVALLEPGLRDLVARTRAAVDSAVLANRT